MILRTLLTALLLSFVVSTASAQDTSSDMTSDMMVETPAGLVSVASAFDMDETQARLELAISETGLNLVFMLDHAANAERVDLDLRPTRLFLFGNPNVGTPLMQGAQSIAIDLPQKMLIWEAEDGQVYLGYNDPMYLAARHGLTGQDMRLGNIANALANLANAATTE